MCVDLFRWRRCFPHAQSLYMFHNNKCQPWTDKSFQQLHGLRTLQLKVDHTELFDGDNDDDSYEKYEKTLKEDTPNITDVAFQSLSSLRELDRYMCDLLPVSDHAFLTMVNLHTLDITNCGQFTDDMFQHLPNFILLSLTNVLKSRMQHLCISTLHTLSMRHCNNKLLTDLAFSHLSNLRTLCMDWCSQSTISHGAYRHLGRVAFLSAAFIQFDDNCFNDLTSNTADVSIRSGLCLNGGKITDNTFSTFQRLYDDQQAQCTLRFLSVQGCKSLTSNALLHPFVACLHTLNISKINVSDEGFARLGNLHTLIVRSNVLITDAAMFPLVHLHTFNMAVVTLLELIVLPSCILYEPVAAKKLQWMP